MPVLVTDELNSPEYKPRSIDYKKYFGEMGLTKEQTKNRIDMANDIEDLMLFIFALIGVYSQYGMPDYTRIQNELQSRFETIISNYGTMDDYLQMFAQDFASDFIEVTELKVDKPWYTSEDRAKFIAENEANAVHNYLDFEKAVKEGYTKKQWITLMDGKERPTHAKINKKIIPIGDLFAVGDALMRFPMDTEYASDFPREIIRCRCKVVYLERDTGRTVEGSYEGGASYGAYTDANDPDYSIRQAIAERLYAQISNRDPVYEIEAVARNSGFSYEDVERIYKHIFVRKHLLSNGVRKFDPDYYMAHSWLRLREGKKIYPHDITMLNHELAEEKIMGESIDIPYSEAHNRVVVKYDYQKELEEYLKTHDA